MPIVNMEYKTKWNILDSPAVALSVAVFFLLLLQTAAPTPWELTCSPRPWRGECILPEGTGGTESAFFCQCNYMQNNGESTFFEFQ